MIWKEPNMFTGGYTVFGYCKLCNKGATVEVVGCPEEETTNRFVKVAEISLQSQLEKHECK